MPKNIEMSAWFLVRVYGRGRLAVRFRIDCRRNYKKMKAVLELVEECSVGRTVDSIIRSVYDHGNGVLVAEKLWDFAVFVFDFTGVRLP